MIEKITEHTARAGAGTLHYVTAGDPSKTPALLLHGWPQSWFEWRRVIPLLAPDYYVIAPAPRGLAMSSGGPGDYTKKALAADLRALVTDTLHLDRFHLVGHDWGGPIAVHLAAMLPDRVRTLAVLDVTMPGDGRGGAMSIGPKWHIAFNMVPGLPETLTAGRERAYLTWYFTHYCTTPGALDDSFETYIALYERPRVLADSFGYYTAIAADAADTAALRAAARLAMPVAAIGGGESRAGEVADSMRQLARDVVGYSFDGCGHFVPEERPAETVAALRALFASG